MIEINQETVGVICSGLGLLSKYSLINEQSKLHLKYLPLSEHDTVDEWLAVLMRMLFVSTSSKVCSYEIVDVPEIVGVLENYDDDCYDWHFEDFLSNFGYECWEESLEEEESYIQDYTEYFLGLGMHVLKISSPLISITHELNSSIVDHVPYLLGAYYGISRCELINSVLEEHEGETVVSIYYFNDHYGDLYSSIDTSRTFEVLDVTVSLYNSLSRSEVS